MGCLPLEVCAEIKLHDAARELVTFPGLRGQGDTSDKQCFLPEGSVLSSKSVPFGRGQHGASSLVHTCPVTSSGRQPMVPAPAQHSVSLDAALLVLGRQENWSLTPSRGGKGAKCPSLGWDGDEGQRGQATHPQRSHSCSWECAQPSAGWDGEVAPQTTWNHQLKGTYERGH